MVITGILPQETEIRYHPNLTVMTYKGGYIKPRKYYCINGLNAGHTYKAYNNSIRTMARAVNERLFYIHEDGEYKEPPKPQPGLFDDDDPFTCRLDKLRYCATRMQSEDFADCYSGSKKLRYLAASDKYRRVGINRKDSFWKTFPKYEMYDFTEKENPVPRGINPRSDVYLVELGRFLRPIEKRIYRAINDVYGYTAVLKGKNNGERGKVIAEHFASVPNPVCIALDASRFEQSCSIDVLHWEHRRYMKYYPGDSYFKKLLKWQRNNVGYAYHTDGKLKFKIAGGRGSGDYNTGLGNNLITARLVYLVMIRLKIQNYRFFCDGDDACVIIPQTSVAVFSSLAKAMFREYGFRMKLGQPVMDIEKIDFCSARPVYDGENYIMVRSPQTIFGKDTLARHDLSTETKWNDWAFAVGSCHLALGGGMPIQQSFAMALLRATKSTELKTVYLDDWKMTNAWARMARKESTITDRTRYSYWLAFGISPEEQIAIEKYLDGIALGYDLDKVIAPKMVGIPDRRLPTYLPGIQF